MKRMASLVSLFSFLAATSACRPRDCQVTARETLHRIVDMVEIKADPEMASLREPGEVTLWSREALHVAVDVELLPGKGYKAVGCPLLADEKKRKGQRLHCVRLEGDAEVRIALHGTATCENWFSKEDIVTGPEIRKFRFHFGAEGDRR